MLYSSVSGADAGEAQLELEYVTAHIVRQC